MKKLKDGEYNFTICNEEEYHWAKRRIEKIREFYDKHYYTGSDNRGVYNLLKREQELHREEVKLKAAIRNWERCNRRKRLIRERTVV